MRLIDVMTQVDKKKLIIAGGVTVAILTLVWLLGKYGGYSDSPPPKTVHHKAKPIIKPEVVARAKPLPRPPKPILVGTPDYLDSKNGFRDMVFGQPESDFTNLVLKEEDEAHQLATYTRSGDILNLEEVPLESIEYTFFNGQLARVTLKWNLEHPDSLLAGAPSTEVAARCSELYGHPRRQSVRKDSTQYIWSGKKVEIILDEFQVPGLANIGKSGWAIPPTTTGQMIFESIPAEHNMKAVMANQIFGSQTGL